MKNYGKLAGGIVAVWLLVAVAASAMQVFQGNGNRLGVAVAIAATTPILLFVTWYAFSEGFREFTHSLNPRTLTLLQSWRVLGVTFVVLGTYNLLPKLFAVPAGYGDMFIGVTASLVAWKLTNPGSRGWFVTWQVLGIADLLTAVGLGVTAPMIDPTGIAMTPMTILPLSLIPTFFVPLLFVVQLICIAQARKWSRKEGCGKSQLRSAESAFAN